MEAERRPVTVLFADMVGFTAFSERRGEEAAYMLMRSLSKLMGESVNEQGGIVQSFTGDGIMAVFGAPVAFEDAPLRACRAAVAILERLKQAEPDLEAKHGIRPEMRIGLNTGPAVIGKVGGYADAGISVHGDTVNFAARLQALAAPGSAIMSETTHRLVQGMVEASFAGEHSVKGKSEPQKTYRLNAVRQGAKRFDAAVSRDSALLSDVNANWRCWSAGSPRQLPTSCHRSGGRAGHGQVAPSSRVPPDASVVSAPLFYQETARPTASRHHFFPSSKWFAARSGSAPAKQRRRLRKNWNGTDGGRPQLGARNLGLLLHLLGLKVPDRALKGLDGVLIGLRTRELLQQLLEARCRLSPVVMVIEDLHWIDSVSEELLGKIVNSEAKLRLLLLTTRRPEYVACLARLVGRHQITS